MTDGKTRKRSIGRRRQGDLRTLNVIVYCLIVLALFLGGMAVWKRYSKQQRPGEQTREPDDAAERQIDAAMPNFAFAEHWTQAGGLPRRFSQLCCFTCPQCQSSCWTRIRGCPTCPFCGRGMVGGKLDILPVGMQGTFSRCRFTCPQCKSLCWTRTRGCPACPICGRSMVRQRPGISIAEETMMKIAMPLVKIQADSAPPHGNRGACTNCHTVISPSAPSPGLTPVGVAQNRRKFINNNAAAPAISPNAVPPTLIKEFGMEVSSAGNTGVKVTGIMGNSYASKAGFRAGDIIIKCNRTKVHSVEQFQQQVFRAAPETDAQITVLRNGRTRDLAIMVGEGEMEGFTPIR